MCDTCGCTTKPADNTKCAVCDKSLSEYTCEPTNKTEEQPSQPTIPPTETPTEEKKQE